MSYEIKFVGTHQEKTASAMLAVEEYLGSDMARLDRFIEVVITRSRSPKALYKACRMFCACNGISGYYPVRAVAGYAISKLKAVH